MLFKKILNVVCEEQYIDISFIMELSYDIASRTTQLIQNTLQLGKNHKTGVFFYINTREPESHLSTQYIEIKRSVIFFMPKKWVYRIEKGNKT